MTIFFANFLGDLSFRGGISWWILVPLILIGIAFSVFVYLTDSVRISPFRRIVLGTLRALIIFVVVLLLNKPVWVRTVTVEKPRPVALMIDNTQSMLQKDPRLQNEDKVRVGIARDLLAPDAGLKADSSAVPIYRPSRLEQVTGIFENRRLKLAETLREKGPLQVFLFGAKSINKADNPEMTWLKELKGTESSTALTDSVAEIFKRDSNELPSAIFVVTDGRDNAGTIGWEDLILEAKKREVPIHVYGVGGSNIGYLQLRDVPIQETLFVDDSVNIPVRWRAAGLKGTEAEITLKIRDQVIASKKVILKEDEGVETLTYKPTEKEAEAGGRQDIVASIKTLRSADNIEDRVTRSVRIVRSKVKVLFVEGNPRFEYKFMQTVLQRDRRVEASFIVVNGDKKAMESGPPFLPEFPRERKELMNFDLLILGDVDANYLSKDQQEWIRDFVAEGGGFIMIAGRQHAPADYLNTPIGEILPVEYAAQKFPIDDAKRPDEYHPRRTEYGKRSPILSMADDSEENERIWNQLPGWYWNYPVTKLKPAAMALLEHPKTQVDGKPMPLMAMQYYGKGLSMFLATDETWRWRYNEAEKYFGRFWGQVIYAIGLPRTLVNKSGSLALGNDEPSLGKPTKVYARLYDNDFRPLKKEKVLAKLERQVPGKAMTETLNQIVFERVPDMPEGEYYATLPNDQQGEFILTIQGESTRDPARMEYRVSLPPEHEQAPGPMNEPALRALAEGSGGKFYREEDLYMLSKELKAKTVSFNQRRETLLWESWWVWFTLVTLFTLEWVIRKFSNMS